jgi:hypothetical protein
MTEVRKRSSRSVSAAGEAVTSGSTLTRLDAASCSGPMAASGTGASVSGVDRTFGAAISKKDALALARFSRHVVSVSMFSRTASSSSKSRCLSASAARASSFSRASRTFSSRRMRRLSFSASRCLSDA